ncbi:MAG: cytochrome C oxidase subunit I [Burkholderiaceae bacterium]|nr:cytochrome C oxidase subunit I [Burkholderiaceae bacterium]
MQSTNAGAVLADAREGSQAPVPAGAEARRRRSGRRKMLAILLVCAAPVIASYYTYYVVRPEGRTNYGTLIAPRDVGALGTRIATVGTPGEAAQDPARPSGPASAPAGGIASMHGRWVMLAVAPAACDAGCRQRLYEIRQVRLTTGKDRDRVERAWIIDDDGAPDPALLAGHEGLVLMRADRATLARELPADPGTAVSDHIYVVDPLGNLMMRFPKDADPNRMKKDLAKLLRASRVG